MSSLINPDCYRLLDDIASRLQLGTEAHVRPPIGSFHNSKVYKLEQRELGRNFALKLFNEAASLEPDRYVNRDILHAEIMRVKPRVGHSFNEWLDEYLIALPPLEDLVDGPNLITLGHHAYPDDSLPIYWTATEWLEEGIENISSEELAKLLLKQHKYLFNGIRVNLQAEAPYWNWKRWTDALIEMYEGHPVSTNSNAKKALLVLRQLASEDDSARSTITHGDIHPNNLKKSQNEFLLFDWEEIAIAPPERDIGIIIERYYIAADGFPNIQETINLYRQSSELSVPIIKFYAFLARFKRAIMKGIGFPDEGFLNEIDLLTTP